MSELLRGEWIIYEVGDNRFDLGSLAANVICSGPLFMG